MGVALSSELTSLIITRRAQLFLRLMHKPERAGVRMCRNPAALGRPSVGPATVDVEVLACRVLAFALAVPGFGTPVTG